MKKKLVLVLLATMILSLSGCGLQLRDRSNEDTGKTSDKDDDDDDDDNSTSGAAGVTFRPTVNYETDDDIATFIIDAGTSLEIDSWLGICEKGEYIYESVADEYDITYAYPEDYYDEDGNPSSGPYTYLLYYSYIDDGDYTLVLTNTDDDGLVVFYAPCTIKNGELTVDTDELVYNAIPSNSTTNVPTIDGSNIDPNSYDPNAYDPTAYDPNAYTDPGNGYTGNDYTGNGYESDPLEYATATNSAVSEAQAVGVSKRNDTLVLKYTGTENVCGESSLYYVLGGFYDNGDVNWVTGTSRFWYFFDNETSFNIAFEAFKSNPDVIIKEYNPVSHYFSVIGFFMNDWETYDGIVSDVNNGILPENIPPSPDYMVVQ